MGQPGHPRHPTAPLPHQVGVVEQTESAAFREASSSKPFDRRLTKVFTRATFVPEDDAARSATETGVGPGAARLARVCEIAFPAHGRV